MLEQTLGWLLLTGWLIGVLYFLCNKQEVEDLRKEVEKKLK